MRQGLKFIIMLVLCALMAFSIDLMTNKIQFVDQCKMKSPFDNKEICYNEDFRMCVEEEPEEEHWDNQLQWECLAYARRDRTED